MDESRQDESPSDEERSVRACQLASVAHAYVCAHARHSGHAHAHARVNVDADEYLPPPPPPATRGLMASIMASIQASPMYLQSDLRKLRSSAVRR